MSLEYELFLLELMNYNFHVTTNGSENQSQSYALRKLFLDKCLGLGNPTHLIKNNTKTRFG